MHKSIATHPINNLTSQEEIINRIYEQIRMVSNDSIRYELSDLMICLELKLEGESKK